MAINCQCDQLNQLWQRDSKLRRRRRNSDSLTMDETREFTQNKVKRKTRKELLITKSFAFIISHFHPFTYTRHWGCTEAPHHASVAVAWNYCCRQLPPPPPLLCLRRSENGLQREKKKIRRILHLLLQLTFTWVLLLLCCVYIKNKLPLHTQNQALLPLGVGLPSSSIPWRCFHSQQKHSFVASLPPRANIYPESPLFSLLSHYRDTKPNAKQSLLMVLCGKVFLPRIR